MFSVSFNTTLYLHYLDKIVRAQPSTAMSCVAARKLSAKKTAVMMVTLGASADPSPKRVLMFDDKISIKKPKD